MGFTDQNAMLTTAQREFLRGESEVDDAVYRHRIRKRIRRSLADFALVFRYMDARDWYDIVLDEDIDDPVKHPGYADNEDEDVPELVWDAVEGPDGNPIFTGGFRHAHAWMYFGLLCLKVEEEYPIEPLIEELVSEGLQDAFGQLLEIVTVSVDVRIEPQDVEIQELHQKLEEGIISDQELEWLIQLRLVDPQEVHDILSND